MMANRTKFWLYTFNIIDNKMFTVSKHKPILYPYDLWIWRVSAINNGWTYGMVINFISNSHFSFDFILETVTFQFDGYWMSFDKYSKLDARWFDMLFSNQYNRLPSQNRINSLLLLLSALLHSSLSLGFRNFYWIKNFSDKNFFFPIDWILECVRLPNVFSI